MCSSLLLAWKISSRGRESWSHTYVDLECFVKALTSRAWWAEAEPGDRTRVISRKDICAPINRGFRWSRLSVILRSQISHDWNSTNGPQSHQVLKRPGWSRWIVQDPIRIEFYWKCCYPILTSVPKSFIHYTVNEIKVRPALSWICQSGRQLTIPITRRKRSPPWTTWL